MIVQSDQQNPNSAHPNFEKSKNFANCVLGQLIMENKIPSKYAFTIGSSFYHNPAAFEETFASIKSTAVIPPQMMAMAEHQLLVQATEVTMMSIAAQVVTEKEPINYYEYMINKGAHIIVIQEAYADGLITEEECGEIQAQLEAVKLGFNTYIAVGIEHEPAGFSDEILNISLKQAVLGIKKEKERSAQMKAQQEALQQMLGNMNNDGTPVDPAEFEARLKEAGFVPAEGFNGELDEFPGEVADDLTPIADLPVVEIPAPAVATEEKAVDGEPTTPAS